ncbi:TSUP family transporter [Phaeacidiphilus oryzae]|uniref:TSUP family transporter n=1 Tax=Phaeacidiphilus oryzae TaxID=348818 RepID=UPI0005651167|nr:TSUP family transporter [Phaeacidiphilus oryzae]
MSVLLLVAIGVVTGLTTVLFGFGGGFVAVPVIVWMDAGLGAEAAHTAVATSSVVMVVNAAVATAATDRGVLGELRRSRALLVLLGLGGVLGAVAARWAPGAVTQWGFVAYLVGTIVDLLLRPGFFAGRGSGRGRWREGRDAPAAEGGVPAGRGSGRIAGGFGVPIGAVASFLGLGGSVLTVPMLRRSGLAMRTATSLANPLTLAISAPALAVFLVGGGGGGAAAGAGGVLLLGAVDVGAGAALLVGALPVIVALRRRPPEIPDRVYAWTYLGLLVAVTLAMTASAVG